MTIQYNRNTIRTAVLLEHTVFDIVTQTNCRTQWTMQYKCKTEWTIQQTASGQNTSMYSEYSTKLQTAVHITHEHNNKQLHTTASHTENCCKMQHWWYYSMNFQHTVSVAVQLKHIAKQCVLLQNSSWIELTIVCCNVLYSLSVLLCVALSQCVVHCTVLHYNCVL